MSAELPPQSNVEVGSVWRARSGGRFSQATTGPAHVVVKVDAGEVHADVLAPWHPGIVATVDEWPQRFLPDGDVTRAVALCEHGVESARAALAESERLLARARELLAPGEDEARDA